MGAKKRTTAKRSVISITITLAIIAMLVLSAPVRAVDLTIIGPSSGLTDDVVEFDLKLDIETSERIPISNITLTIDGSGAPQVCTFALDGTPIGACPGVTVNLSRNLASSYSNDSLFANAYNGTAYANGYGYGYGYAYAPAVTNEFVWRVTWNTAGKAADTYIIDFAADGEGFHYEAPTSKTIELTAIAPPSAPEVSLGIAPYYPKANNYVFQCNATGFSPDAYDWDFGDGQMQIDSNNSEVYHTYTEDGTYDVSCFASEGLTTEYDYMSVTVDVPATANISQVAHNATHRTLTCNTYGLGGTKVYDWEVRHIASGVQDYYQLDINDSSVYVAFTQNGTYLASCAATSGAETIMTYTFFNASGGTPAATLPVATNATITVTNNTAVLVPLNATLDMQVTIPRNATTTRFNLTQLITNATNQTKVVLPVNVAMQANTSAGVIQVSIPANISITGATNWNAVITMPQITTRTVDLPSGATESLTIEVGDDTQSLTFDKGVRLFFPGQAGKRVGYARSGSITEITSTCSADTQAAGDALAAGADCKMNAENGVDLIVWTKHFTEFTTYTPASTSSGGSSRTTWQMTPPRPANQTVVTTPVETTPVETTPTQPETPVESPITGNVVQETTTPPAETTPETAEEKSASVGKVTKGLENAPGWLFPLTIIIVVGAVVAMYMRRKPEY